MIRKYSMEIIIEAEQYDCSDEVIDKYDLKAPNGGSLRDEDGILVNKRYARISTPEGKILLQQGDWIATGAGGEHWIIKNNVFKQTYAELADNQS